MIMKCPWKYSVISLRALLVITVATYTQRCFNVTSNDRPEIDRGRCSRQPAPEERVVCELSIFERAAIAVARHRRAWRERTARNLQQEQLADGPAGIAVGGAAGWLLSHSS